MAEPRFSSFAAFWPYYLAQHRKPSTRFWHFAGLAVAALLLTLALATEYWIWALAAPLAGYALSWSGHWIAEANRPATFMHPLWSLRGDFRMAALALRGRLEDELARHGIKK